MNGLSSEHFLNCNLYYEDLRKHHRGTITNNNQLEKISDIVCYLKNKNIMDFIERMIVKETDTLCEFEEPLNLNKKFWNSGNNYFFNCIKYGFRKNVVPYKEANKYIKNVGAPMLYSGQYYSSLEKMSDYEIREFLKNNPIGIEGQIITHGIHRVCAMINRLINDESYIAFSLGKGY